MLDKDASLDEIGSKTHAVEKGLIRETKKTPQTIIGTDAIQKKSGDGTVPYWSLQQCRMWQGKGVAECDVKVHEIESAEHRAILNDSRFHDILLEILGIVN